MLVKYTSPLRASTPAASPSSGRLYPFEKTVLVSARPVPFAALFDALEPVEST